MKLAIIVRKDLGMSTGKVATQVGHASVMAYKMSSATHEGLQWYEEGQKKIILKVNSLIELVQIKSLAMYENINVNTVIDFGLTQIEPNTMTCIAIGPDTDEKINKIIKDLKLY